MYGQNYIDNKKVDLPQKLAPVPPSCKTFKFCSKFKETNNELPLNQITERFSMLNILRLISLQNH